jgi:hypothetical protein
MSIVTKTINEQLEILNRLGLGKRAKRCVLRKRWTESNELAAFGLYINPDFSDEKVKLVAETIGHSEASLRMKLANIDSIVTGSRKGLNHVSKLTLDIVNTNKHLLK